MISSELRAKLGGVVECGLRRLTSYGARPLPSGAAESAVCSGRDPYMLCYRAMLCYPYMLCYRAMLCLSALYPALQRHGSGRDFRPVSLASVTSVTGADSAAIRRNPCRRCLICLSSIPMSIARVTVDSYSSSVVRRGVQRSAPLRKVCPRAAPRPLATLRRRCFAIRSCRHVSRRAQPPVSDNNYTFEAQWGITSPKSWRDPGV